MSETLPLVTATRVRKVYRTDSVEVIVLRGLDLTVRPGELVGVMGPPGSRKTTRLNCLSVLDDIDGGRVEIDASMMVVAVAMAGSVTVLPALLSLLGERVEKGRVPFLNTEFPSLAMCHEPAGQTPMPWNSPGTFQGLSRLPWRRSRDFPPRKHGRP